VPGVTLHISKHKLLM